jgi:transposase-like protein
MNIPHRIVQTTVYSRTMLIKEGQRTKYGVKEAAAQQGISPRTTYKWLGDATRKAARRPLKRGLAVLQRKPQAVWPWSVWPI